MKIGSNIKKIRAAKGITQQELASLANISRSYLGDLECDRYNPSIDTLFAVANALEVDITKLIHEKSVKKADVSDSLSEEAKGIARDYMDMPPKKREMFHKLLNLMSEDADRELLDR